MYENNNIAAMNNDSFGSSDENDGERDKDIQNQINAFMHMRNFL